MPKREPYEGICPFHCRKYTAALQAAQKLHQENKALERHRKVLDDIIRLSAEYDILGIEEQNGTVFVAVMVPVDEHTYVDSRHLYLFALPFIRPDLWRSKIDLFIKPNCRAHLQNWHANPGNSGYGSILMKYLLSFLRSAGFRTLTGMISSTDFDHEDMLRHTYSKFGFEIKDRSDYRWLHLNLYKKENKVVCKDDCIVCCRTEEHDFIERGQLLKQP